MIIQRRRGQSLMEYVVLLALIAIVAVAIVAGVGKSTRDRVAQANPSQEEAVIASKGGVSAAAAAKPGNGGLTSSRHD